MVDKLIKRKEAAEMLGISLDTLDHARMEGLITYVQYVENWLKKCEIYFYTKTALII